MDATWRDHGLGRERGERHGERLTLRISLDQLWRSIQGFALRVALACALFVALTALLTLRVTRRISAPLRGLEQLVEQVSAGNLEQKLVVRGGGEVDRITSADPRLDEFIAGRETNRD